MVIALDTPTEPQDAADALFATDNFKAGRADRPVRQGRAWAASRRRSPRSTWRPGVSVGVLRHNGFLKGFGVRPRRDPQVVCSRTTGGDQAKGQTAMENCLQKNPGINLVYTINEPAARRRVHRAEGRGQGQGRA